MSRYFQPLKQMFHHTKVEKNKIISTIIICQEMTFFILSSQINLPMFTDVHDMGGGRGGGVSGWGVVKATSVVSLFYLMAENLAMSEPCRGKNGLLGFQLLRHCTIPVAKRKALFMCAATSQLICTFVFCFRLGKHQVLS